MKDGKDAGVQDLTERTRRFALRVLKLYGALPKTVEAQVLGKQLLRSGTSVGAHYREAVRARSTRELISKFEGALQELEETAYWLELLEQGGVFDDPRVRWLTKEADELTAILVTCVLKAKPTNPRRVPPEPQES
ncbi:MAG: four helix bundle protein [Armatimonadetes bacterium]|nr:four helix bundle protein [Armatimonadota bacterium]